MKGRKKKENENTKSCERIPVFRLVTRQHGTQSALIEKQVKFQPREDSSFGPTAAGASCEED
jgi:hypothetical protein